MVLSAILEFNKLNNPLNVEQVVGQIATAIKKAGGRALMVGGCVRDAMMGITPKDIDIEVFGIEAQHLERIVGENFEYDSCGVSFGVLKLKHIDIDISLPRRESKIGLGHRAFNIASDPFMSVEEASLRRDFTINSMYKDPLTGEIIDPNGGKNDLEQKILRHVSHKFSEDPLRVLRGAQFVARFDLEAHDTTIDICRAITPESLAAERIFEEWKKLILKGVKISKGLQFLQATNWVKYFPELNALIGCKQEPKWHPEGDVWEHTKCCLDFYAKNRIGEQYEDLVVGMAVLCHDFGKPSCTFFDEKVGRLRSLGHDEKGVGPTYSFLSRMTNEEKFISDVVPLVKNHMRPFSMWRSDARDGAVRRLSCQVKRIDRLIRVCLADDGGRPPFPSDTSSLDWLAAQAKRLDVQDKAPKPILMGRDLLSLGLKAGPLFKKILDEAYDNQIEGVFSDLDGAKKWLKEKLLTLENC